MTIDLCAQLAQALTGVSRGGRQDDPPDCSNLVRHRPYCPGVTRHRIPMGQLDLGRVSNMRHVVDLSWARADRAMDSDVGQILTTRRMDEAQVAGTRVDIGAHAQLLNAMDNLDGLWALLQHHGATTWAPWNLLRPAFEAAFRALWVLEPTEGLTRRRRGLRLEVINYIQRLNHLHELVAIPGLSKLVGGELALRSHADVESVYRREAEALGLTYGQAEGADQRGR